MDANTLGRLQAGLPDTDPEAVRDLVHGNNTFACKLYQELCSTPGNLFHSPLSISTAMAMTMVGARGVTQTQMQDALALPLDQGHLHQTFGSVVFDLQAEALQNQNQLFLATALWCQKGRSFLDTFLDCVESCYAATASAVDFKKAAEAARLTINEWVEDRTKGRIPDLLPPGQLTPLVRLVLTSAVYFHGRWDQQFDPKKTRAKQFHLAAGLRGAKISVPMMQLTGTFGYGAFQGLRALEIPYEGGELVMLILLPDKVGQLGAVEAQLTAENVAGWVAGLVPTRVEVSVPKFRLDCSAELKTVLQSMGVRDAFDDRLADFSGMVASNDLVIDGVVHKAFVDVAEEGTEAAAATAVVVRLRSGGSTSKVPVFCADHPFVFLIRHRRTASILFCGRVANPAPA